MPRTAMISAILLMWGLWTFLPKLTVGHIGPRSAMVYHTVGGLLVGLYALWSIGFKLEYHPAGAAMALLTGVLGVTGSLLFYYLVMSEKVSIATIITSLYPAVGVALAVLFLHESLSPRQGIGAVLALVALTLLAT